VRRGALRLRAYRALGVVALAVGCWLCSGGGALADVGAFAAPTLRGHVNDYASLLPEDDARRLEARLARFQTKTGHQFALLIVPSLGGLPLEEYSLKAAEAWRLGDKARDDGLLMVIAQQDRKMRIEVGYGLEGDIPDAIASRVIREVLRPAFQRGSYAYGVAAAFDVLIRAAGGDGEEPPQAPVQPRHTTHGGGGGIPFFLIVVVLFAIVNVLSRGSGRRRSGYFGPTGGFGGGGFGGGGFGGGGFGGGGGGGDGGGFSGGGGDFGGGGASGDW